MSFDMLETSIDVLLVKSDPPLMGEFTRALESSRHVLEKTRRVGKLTKPQVSLLGCVVWLLTKIDIIGNLCDFSIDGPETPEFVLERVQKLVGLLRKVYQIFGVVRVMTNNSVKAVGDVKVRVLRSMLREDHRDDENLEPSRVKHVKASSRYPVVDKPLLVRSSEYVPSKADPSKRWSVVAGGSDVAFDPTVEAVTGFGFSSSYLLNQRLKTARELTDEQYAVASEARAQFGLRPFVESEHWPPKFRVSANRMAAWRRTIDAYKARKPADRKSITLTVNNSYAACHEHGSTHNPYYVAMSYRANIYEVLNSYEPVQARARVLGDYFAPGTYFRVRDKVFFKLSEYANYVASLLLSNEDKHIFFYLCHCVSLALQSRKNNIALLGSVVNCVSAALHAQTRSKGKSVFQFLFTGSPYLFVNGFICKVDVPLYMHSVYNGMLAECFRLQASFKPVEKPVETNKLQGLESLLSSNPFGFVPDDWDKWSVELPFFVRFMCLYVVFSESNSWKTCVSSVVLSIQDFDATIVNGAKLLTELVGQLQLAFGKLVSEMKDVKFQGAGSSSRASGPTYSDNDVSFEARAMASVRSALMAPDGSSFASSDLGVALWELFASFSVVGMFAMSGISGSAGMVKQKIKDFSYLLRDDGRENVVESFMSKLLRLVRVLATRVHTAVKERDWRLLLRDDMTFAKWGEWVDTLIEDECIRFDPARPAMERTFQLKKASGCLPPQFYKTLDAAERLAMLREALTFCPDLKARYATSPPILAMLRNKEVSCMGVIRSMEATTANASFKIQAWGIFVCGAPSVGKTTLMSRFHTSLGEFLGYPGGSSTMYRPDPKNNYEDGFNQSQWAALCDDIDLSVAPEAAGVRNHVELMNKYINTAPYCMEQAAVESKGKLYANFLAVYYLTNNANGNLKGRCLHPTQFWRRFLLYITMKIKPEFDDGSGGIHRENAFIGDKLKPDIWRFEVQSYDPKYGNDNDKWNVLPYGPPVVFENENDLFRALIQHYNAYHVRQRAAFSVKVEAERQDIPKCPQCYTSIELHSNGRFCEGEAVKLQGGVDSVFLLYNVVWYGAAIYGISTLFERGVARIRKEISDLPVSIRDMLRIWVTRRFFETFGYSNYVIGVVARLYENRASLYDSLENNYWYMYFRDRVPQKRVLMTLGLLLAGIPIMRRYFDQRTLQGADVPNPTGLPRRVDVWQNVDKKMFDRPYSVRSKPTYTRAEMCAVLQKRMVRVTGPVCTVYGVMCAGGILMFPKHCLIEKDPRNFHGSVKCTIVVESAGVTHTIIAVPRLTTLLPYRDIVVTYAPEITVFKDKWDLLAEIPPTCLASSQERADEAWLVLPNEIKQYDGPLVACNRYNSMFPEKYGCWAGSLDTQDGDCGAPVVARFGDRFYWVGAHGVERRQQFVTGEVVTAIAESYAMRELSIAIDNIKRFNPSSMEVVFDPKTVDPEAEVLAFQGLPKNSSLNVSLCFKPNLPISVFGTYVGPVRFGASLKTKVTMTGFDHPTLRRLTAELLNGDEFKPPVFKGGMKVVEVDGEEILRWVDPHTRALEQSRNIGGDSVYWDAATIDYLSGLDKLFGSTGIVPLSDYATITGVDGTTCGSIDLQTSAGAPFYRKKNVCVRIDRSETPPKVQLIDELAQGIERILAIIDAGDVYSPVAVHCLKDECVTAAKNMKSKVRVFNIMPFAFNFLLKKYISPIVAFFRLHNYHFEHAIGLNIAGVKDANNLHAFLTRYPNCSASDVSDFDISASTRELLYSSVVIQKMGSQLGYSPSECKRLWGLLMSAMHVTHVNKGDFWFSNYGLATGYWITLFMNCIRNSLQSRYAYYALGVGKHLPPFRSVVNLMVLGDDNISCVHPEFDWYNQVTVATCLLSIGAVRTSSRKGEELVPYERFSEATFLKRMFTKQHGVSVCPIEKKTLLRMLTCRRATTLSDHDHKCVILSTVLAESWMWGREFFDEMFLMCYDLAAAHGLSGKNLLMESFDEYVRKYKTGELITWDNRLSEEEAFFI